MRTQRNENLTCNTPATLVPLFVCVRLLHELISIFVWFIPHDYFCLFCFHPAFFHIWILFFVFFFFNLLCCSAEPEHGKSICGLNRTPTQEKWLPINHPTPALILTVAQLSVSFYLLFSSFWLTTLSLVVSCLDFGGLFHFFSLCFWFNITFRLIRLG